MNSGIQRSGLLLIGTNSYRWRALLTVLALLLGCAYSNNMQQLDGSSVNVDPQLLALSNEFESYVARLGSADGFSTNLANLLISEGRVFIDAVATGDAGNLGKDLEMIGGEEVSVYGQLVSCRLPIDRIESLRSLSSLKFARPSQASTRR